MCIWRLDIWYSIYPLRVCLYIRFVVDTVNLWALPLPPTLSVGYHMRPPKHWTWDLNINPLQKVTANPAPAAPCQLSAPPSSCLPNDIPNETSGGSLSHTETVWANRRRWGERHIHINFPTCPSIAAWLTPRRSFMKFHQPLLQVFWPVVAQIHREREREREIKPQRRRGYPWNQPIFEIHKRPRTWKRKPGSINHISPSSSA